MYVGIHLASSFAHIPRPSVPFKSTARSDNNDDYVRGRISFRQVESDHAFLKTTCYHIYT